MAKNDIILIDSIISQRIKDRIPSENNGEVFEFMAYEQILKEYDLNKDEIIQGSVDGKDDGGIDAIYIFVNGNLLSDIDEFIWPKRSCEISVYIITCKHHDTFKQDVLNNEYATISEFFDLSRSNSELKASYNSDLLTKRQLFVGAYTRTAINLDNLYFHFIYASRGDISCIGENIIARSEQIKQQMLMLFSNCQPNYDFLGSTELLTLYRKKPKYELNLYHKGIISYRDECHIVLCRLSDFYSFITDDNGRLKKYIFDSNVRDYMGTNPVNVDIMNSLVDSKDIDFWWLNNGITILARSAINVGTFIKVQDVQIVNGLQTSQTIHKFFNQKNGITDERCVMIKIITQNNSEVRDCIIRSTNNQTAIMTKSLFATDKIQRDIEDVMHINGLYYERRTNCFANKDIDNNLVFDIMYMAAAYLAIILKAPEKAANFKQKFLKRADLYNTIFNSNDSLNIWPRLALILKQTDKVLSRIIGSRNTEKMLKRSRYVVAIISLSRCFGTFNYSINQVINLDPHKYDDLLITDTWNNCVSKWYNKEKMLNREYLIAILEQASSLWDIQDLDSFAKHKNSFTTMNNAVTYKLPPNEKTIQLVNANLPKQPWPIGVHKQMASLLNIPTAEVYAAINELISRGLRYKQVDGVVYDKDGQIILRDENRNQM